MKLDIKSILILILLFGCLIFGYMWYFNTDNTDYKKELKELREDNKMLQEQRDSINHELKILESDFLILKTNESFYLDKIDKLEIEIEKAKNNANKSKAELDKIRKELAEVRKKIQEFKNNPPVLTDDDLLNSLKINLKR
jgi:chromosome segregation ATPase